MNTSACSKQALFAALLLNGLGASGALGSGCPSPGFNGLTALPAGDYPIAVAVGDFNGDGRPDVATANQDPANQLSHTISILLGNGDGTFLAASNYPAGLYPSSIATGEFNGDTHLDLAVANNAFPGAVLVFLGNGNGTFQPATSYGTGSSPSSVAVADFNEDSRLDLVTANFIAAGAVSVLLGKGDGSFYPGTNYAAGRFPESVAVGDFNEDTHLDLALAEENGVSVLLGNGDGTFQ